MDTLNRRFDRRRVVTAVAAGLTLSLPLARPGAAETTPASVVSGWQTWSENVIASPDSPVRWRALLYKAKPLSQAPFANRTLGFVWNDDGRATLIVENATRAITHELDQQTGHRAVSFNHEQDSEARGVRDEDADDVWPYRYFNFDLYTADGYDLKEARGDGELWGWSIPFTIPGPETRLAFGAITVAPREAASYVPGDGEAGQQPVLAMCLEGRFTPFLKGGGAGAEIEPGDFVEFSTESAFERLYGSGINNVLVGVRSPGAGEFVLENLAT